jgi:hypothetical protein
VVVEGNKVITDAECRIEPWVDSDVIAGVMENKERNRDGGWIVLSSLNFNQKVISFDKSYTNLGIRTFKARE